MKVYVYGIIDSNTPLNNMCTGLEAAAVYGIFYKDIGAVVSDFDERLEDITPESIVKHEEVIEKMAEKGTVLPMRFLSLFNENENVMYMLKAYYNSFKNNLDLLRDKAEFGIKIIWSGDLFKERLMYVPNKTRDDLLSSDSPGKSFIKNKFEKYKIDKKFQEEADKHIDYVDNIFSPFAIEKRIERLKTENLLLSASYLVEKKKEDAFKAAFETFRKNSGDLKYLFSGPWPPYNFVRLMNETG